MEGARMKATYEDPTVQDYGDVRDLTAAVAQCGTEDGAAKSVSNHHTSPCA